MTRVRAIRGATTADSDSAAAITSATAELLEAMIARNALSPDDLISVVFTATADLTAGFPAAAARSLGMSDVPLLCAQEIAVRDALPRCIRVLMHVQTGAAKGELRHVYLNGAVDLRTDLVDD